MEVGGNLIFVLSVIWIVWQFIRTRKRASKGEIIVPPFFAGLMLFSLCVICVIVFRISPFHCIWLFPVSYILGTVLLFFPVVQKTTKTLLLMLAIPMRLEAEERGQVVINKKKKRRNRQPGSTRKKR
jgi:hypothetical protein